MTTYAIALRGRVQGVHLSALEGFDEVPGNPGETRFVGEIPEQEYLHRILERIAAFNLDLVSIDRVDPAAISEPAHEKGPDSSRGRRDQP